MALRDILVCIDSASAADDRLKLAVALARRNKAHLAAAYIMPLSSGLSAQFSPGLPLVSERGVIGLAGGGLTNGDVPPVVSPGSQDAERAEAVERRFRDELQLNSLDGDWHLFDAGDAPEVIELAKTVDLTVTGQAGFRPEDVALGAARPVLAIPYAGTFDSVGRRALVAWDGSREAVRAVNDALPLLGEAEAVTVMFVGSQEASLDQQRLSLDRMVRHLQRHGIAARAEATLRGELAIGDILLSRAADLAADLIIAGVYHHSSLREALIGGVSRDLLDHMTVPVLLSH